MPFKEPRSWGTTGLRYNATVILACSSGVALFGINGACVICAGTLSVAGVVPDAAGVVYAGFLGIAGHLGDDALVVRAGSLSVAGSLLNIAAVIFAGSRANAGLGTTLDETAVMLTGFPGVTGRSYDMRRCRFTLLVLVAASPYTVAGSSVDGAFAFPAGVLVVAGVLPDIGRAISTGVRAVAIIAGENSCLEKQSTNRQEED